MKQRGRKKVRRGSLLCIALGLSIGLTGGTTKGKESPEVQQIKRALEHCYRGMAFSGHGDLDAAIGELREALRLDPNEAYCHGALGEVLEKKGQRESALEEYRQAMKLSPHDFGLTSRYEELSGAEEGPRTNQQATRSAGPTEDFTVGAGISPPKATYRPEPRYSKKARKVKHQGTVVVWIVVDETGSVSRVRVVKPLGLGLDQNAIETIRTWKFKPCVRDGSPLACYVSVEVGFRLYEKQGAPD